jgi:hypothetical protein
MLRSERQRLDKVLEYEACPEMLSMTGMNGLPTFRLAMEL